MSSPPGPSLGRQALSAVAWLSALNGLGGLGMLALAWWLNRTLPDAPVRMGQWSVVLSLLLMTSLIFEGGITAIIQQRKDLDREALAALALFQVALGAAGALLLAAGAAPLARLMASEADVAEVARLIRIMSIAVFVISAGLAPKGLLQRELRFKTVATVEGGATLVTLVLALLFVPRFGVAGLVYATIGRHCVETPLYWMLGDARPWTTLRRPTWAAAKDPLKAGAYMGLQSLLGTAVRQGDVLLIGALTGTVFAGLYRQIQQLVVQPNAKLQSFVVRAAFPALSRVQDDPPRMLRAVTRMQRLLALAVLPMQLGLAAVAPRLLAEFLGEQYRPYFDVAAPAMMLLCLVAAINGYAYSFVVALNASGKGEAVLGRQVASSGAVVAFMAAGAPWGLLGIAAGRVAAAVFQATLLLGLTERVFRFGREALARTIKEALPAASASFAVAFVTGLLLTRAWPASAPFVTGGDPAAMRTALAIQVSAGAVAYAVTLLALKLDPRAELRALRS